MAVAYQISHRIGRHQQPTTRPMHPAQTRTARGSAIEHTTHGHEWSPHPRPSHHPCPAHPDSAARRPAGVVFRAPCADCLSAVELLRSKATYTDKHSPVKNRDVPLCNTMHLLLSAPNAALFAPNAAFVAPNAAFVAPNPPRRFKSRVFPRIKAVRALHSGSQRVLRIKY